MKKKAILIFDWYETLANIQDKELLIYINDKDGHYISTEYAKLKPMPRRIGSRLIIDGEEITSAYQTGWNDCIDEILGEET